MKEVYSSDIIRPDLCSIHSQVPEKIVKAVEGKSQLLGHKIQVIRIKGSTRQIAISFSPTT